MSSFRYKTGQEVQSGDHITYHGESGVVDFVVKNKTDDPALDWYLQRFPGGGLMIKTVTAGSIFITDLDDEEDLAFVSRKAGQEGV